MLTKFKKIGLESKIQFNIIIYINHFKFFKYILIITISLPLIYGD